jgi:hypothetical protein
MLSIGGIAFRIAAVSDICIPGIGFAAPFGVAFAGVRFFAGAVVFFTGFFAGIFIPGVM